jgi:hypothetical protein
MPTYQYATTTGALKDFEAADSTSALQTSSGFADRAPTSGVALKTTTTAPAPTSTISASSTTARDQTKALGATIDSGISTMDQQFDDSGLRDASGKATKEIERQRGELKGMFAADESLINQLFAQTQQALEGQHKKEFAGRSTQLITAGGYLGGTQSHEGVLANLSQQHRGEIAKLALDKYNALQGAKRAYQERDFKLADRLVQESKDLEDNIIKARSDFTKQLREDKKDKFEMSLKIIDRVTPALIQDIEGLNGDALNDYIISAAKDLNVDPMLLAGEISSYQMKTAESERKEILNLATKYVSAGIDPSSDDFSTAMDKVRSSKEYLMNISKGELDIQNSRSLLTQRTLSNRNSTQNIDYSDPVLSLYTQTTGEIVSSPAKARAVVGYADSLLSGKEVVSDDFEGPLLDNQIRSSEAIGIVTSSFAEFNKDEGFKESDGWEWLSSSEAQGMDDEQKKTYLMSNGLNPEDFGLY